MSNSPTLVPGDRRESFQILRDEVHKFKVSLLVKINEPVVRLMIAVSISFRSINHSFMKTDPHISCISKSKSVFSIKIAILTFEESSPRKTT